MEFNIDIDDEDIFEQIFCDDRYVKRLLDYLDDRQFCKVLEMASMVNPNKLTMKTWELNINDLEKLRDNIQKIIDAAMRE